MSALAAALALFAGCAPAPVPLPPSGGPVAAAVLPAATPSATAPAEALRLASVSNFRDVAGAGLELPSGARMANRIVYRSGRLDEVSRADRAALTDAGLALIIDLRTRTEAARRPDRAVAGAEHVRVNIYGTVGLPPRDTPTVSAARAYMREKNRDFVTDPGQRLRLARVLRLVAAADGPVLVHCSAGKDRTGWVAALLQLTAGVGRDQVMAEYLASNDYRAEEIELSYRRVLAARGLQAAQVDRALETVEAGYLNAGLGAMDRRYGSVDRYLRVGLGLSRATVAALRTRLAG